MPATVVILGAGFTAARAALRAEGGSLIDRAKLADPGVPLAEVTA